MRFEAEKEEERRQRELEAMEREEARQWEADTPCEPALSFNQKLLNSKLACVIALRGLYRSLLNFIVGLLGNRTVATLGHTGHTHWPNANHINYLYQKIYKLLCFHMHRVPCFHEVELCDLSSFSVRSFPRLGLSWDIA